MAGTDLTYDEAQRESKQLALKRMKDQLSDQARRLAKARKAAAENRRKLDKMIALAVSSKPASELWYHHPGRLTVDEAVEATGLSLADVDRAVRRYREGVEAGRIRPRAKR